ncbi:MAG: redoxin family protein [Phycisphaerales bacterium]|nr:redoxin family protein [Phycisphaerales bacterium]
MKRFANLLAASLSVAVLAGPALAQDKMKDDAKKDQAPKEEIKSLIVGDMAPKLEVEKFIKGEAVTGYEKGKVYVVEFWATWCGPCIKAFPHLSELQAKHKGKVTFVGVNIWEDSRGSKYSEETAKEVAEFVEKQGDKMSYTVAYDGAAKKMDKAFMRAAGKSGIPAAFIVNGEGKVAWIGHPARMDSVLDDVLAGKWDIKKAADESKAEKESADKARQAMEKARPTIERVREARENEKWEDLVKALGELKAIDPERFAQADVERFMVYINELKQADKAYAMKDELLANKAIASNGMLCNQIAWTLVDPEGDVKNPNVEFALAFAAKGCEVTENKNPAIIDTLARCHWLKGDKAKAIELQEKAIKLCESDEDFSEMKSDLEATLKTYKDGK